MKYNIREFSKTDRKAVITIFNYFVRESDAAYPENEFDVNFVDKIEKSTQLFYVLEMDEKVIGFGFLKPYLEYDNFNHTGMLTYFILPDFTGKGLGTQLLHTLINKGLSMGVTNFLAHISSRNEQSLKFHRKHGFEEVGRFRNVGLKFGDYFDIVWVQKQVSGVLEF